jgi:hypothetical protein
MLFEFWVWIKFKKEMIFKFEFEICFKTNGQGPFWPNWSSWPNRPTWARQSRPGLGLGRSTDPAQPPRSPLSRLEPLWRRRIAAAAAWLLRPTPVVSAVATLGETLASAPSTISSKQNRRPPPLRGDQVDLSSRDLPPPNSSDAVPRRAGACWACSSACASCVNAGGSAKVWCSRCSSVKTSLSRAWSAARALPRHAG